MAPKAERANGRGAAWSTHKGNLSYEPEKEKEEERIGQRGRGKKKIERKGHEWQLIWGVSATPQRAMTSSGIEVREEEKGLFKKLAAYRGRNYICAKHAQVLLCCGGNHFQRWGLEGWINQLCLLWGLFITKNLSHEILRSPPKKKKNRYVQFLLRPVKSEFLPTCTRLFGSSAVHVSCECKTTQNIQTVLNVRIKRKKKKCFTNSNTTPADPSDSEPFSAALGAYKASAVHGG